MTAAMGQARPSSEATRRETGCSDSCRPEQFRELSLLLLIVAADLVFGSLIDGYYSARTFNRIASSVADHHGRRGRPDAGRAHPQHRPVGRLDRRLRRLPRRHADRRPPRDVAVLVAVAASPSRIGAALGAINGVLVAWGRVPVDHRDARHAGDLPRHPRRLRRARKTITTDSLPHWLVDLPRSTAVHASATSRSGRWSSLALVVVVVFQFCCQLPQRRPPLYAIGSNPDAARARGLPTRRIVFTAFVPVGRARRPRRLHVPRALRQHHRRRRPGPRARSRSPPSWSAASTSSAASGTVVGAMLGAVIIGTARAEPLPAAQISEFWRDAVLGLLILLAVGGDARHPRSPAHALGADADRKLDRRNRRRAAAREGRRWQRDARDAPAAELGGPAAGAPRWSSSRSTSRSSPYYLGVDNIVNLFQLSIEKIIVALIDDVHHHQRRDRPLGRLGHGPRGLRDGVAVPSTACRFRLAIAGRARSPARVAGLINGFWVAYVGLPSLAVTLAGLIGYRGIAAHPRRGPLHRRLPDWFNALGQQPLLGPLPFSIIIFVILFVAGGVVLARSALRAAWSTSIGNNPEAARYSGVRVAPRQARRCSSPRAPSRARRAALRGAARLGARRHGQRLRARHHHHGAARRGQHLRRLGHIAGVGLSILLILNLRNGMGLANIKATPRPA